MQMIIARGGIEPPYVAVKERCLEPLGYRALYKAR